MILDLLVRNASIVTMYDAHPRAHTLAVHNGRIVALDTDVRACTEIDAQGAALVPGFGDAHNHMAWFGQGLDAVDLSGLRDLTTLYDRIAERAAATEPGALIVGAGYDHTTLGGHPHRRELDRASGGRPVWLNHRSGHVCTVNSRLLKRIGLLDGTATVPDGGVVITDDAGEPTGVLEEQAQNLVVELVTPYAVAELARTIGMASAVYAAEGLTHVTETGIGAGWIGRSPLELAAYQQAREAGELAVRVQLMPTIDALRPLSGHADDSERLGLDLGVRTGRAGLRVPGSSDRPVAAGAPLLGMQSMVQRLSSSGALIGPDERVDATTALRAYTLDAAWTASEEHERGSLEPGKLADFVVLSDDITDERKVPADLIGGTRVVATFVGGRCTHGASAVGVEERHG